MTTPDIPRLTPAQVRQHLLDRHEIALVDVREEDPFAQAHPLWAVQIGAGRIALDAPWRLPRRDVTIAVYDNGEGLAAPAARQLQAHFRGVLTGTEEADEAYLGKLISLAGVARYPSRIKCALLGWHALGHALQSPLPASTVSATVTP